MSWVFERQHTEQAKVEGVTYELRRLENVVAVESRRTLKSVWFGVKKVGLESYLRDLLRAYDERRRRKKRQKPNSERSLLIYHPQQPNWRAMEYTLRWRVTMGGWSLPP